jgi:hypothetical protein
MKVLVKKVELDKVDVNSVSEALKDFEANKIEILNWEKEFPYKPKVEFRLAHNNENLFIKYNVEEKYIRAIATENNGKVWEDSCCEFFVSFDGLKNYYNLEINCIGTKLLGYGAPKTTRPGATDEVIDRITAVSSLGNAPIESANGEFKWEMVAIVPIASFFGDKLEKFSGVKAKANFYKCGDETMQTHFLSWNKIDLPNPNFHCPEFFGDIEFE